MILGRPTAFWKVSNTNPDTAAPGGGLTPFQTSSPLGIAEHRLMSSASTRPTLQSRSQGTPVTRKVDIRLHGKGNSNSQGARPVHQKHLRHDEVDPDKLVVNKEFSFSFPAHARWRESAYQHNASASRYKTLEGKEEQSEGREEMRTKRENKTKTK